MSNALAQETSPYLRQHAENPVDWLPWTGFGVFVLYGVIATAIAVVLLKRRDA